MAGQEDHPVSGKAGDVFLEKRLRPGIPLADVQGQLLPPVCAGVRVDFGTLPGRDRNDQRALPSRMPASGDVRDGPCLLLRFGFWRHTRPQVVAQLVKPRFARAQLSGDPLDRLLQGGRGRAVGGPFQEGKSISCRQSERGLCGLPCEPRGAPPVLSAIRLGRLCSRGLCRPQPLLPIPRSLPPVAGCRVPFASPSPCPDRPLTPTGESLQEPQQVRAFPCSPWLRPPTPFPRSPP